MTKKKTAAAGTAPALPNPHTGGAWYRRRSDGALVRDRNEDQPVPEVEPALRGELGDQLTGDGTGVALPPIATELRTSEEEA